MSDQPQLSKPRDHWAGRGAFVLAAIGSAVGLGNLWGFPYKLYTYGGGAFLIPYFVAMIVMGVPLLIMEYSVGHWAQNSPPGAFGRVMKRYRFVGWWLAILAFVIICYYAVILGYCVDYLAFSIQGFGAEGLPWTGQSADRAKSFFFDDLLGFEDTMALGGVSWQVLIGTIVAWTLVYLCLFRGVKWVSKVVLITVPLPWLMLVVLTVRGLTLEGAINGLEFYLEPRWEKLLEAETWRWAFGQVFFSMSLGFAVMLSYASFLHRRSDLNNNAMIIGLGDLGTSFIAGIAVFSMLGGMAFATGTPVPDLVPEGTFGLSFVVFPYGLSQLPAAALFSSVFFIALLTLGIDSAFSIVEACLASVCDSKPTWPRRYVLPAICLIGLGLGLAFNLKRGGLNWLGLADGLINGPFGILVVAMSECLVVGWAWNGKFVKRMRDHANERSDWKLYGWWDIVIRFIAPALLAILFVWSILGEVQGQLVDYRDNPETYGLPWTLIGGSLLFIAVPVVGFLWNLRTPIDPEHRARFGGVWKGVVYALSVMAVSGVAIAMLMSRGLLKTREAPFTPDHQLSQTAYVILAVAFLVIFGGLAWCFWRAMLAAGREDTELPDDDQPLDGGGI